MIVCSTPASACLPACSTSYDGSIKMWDANTMELVGEKNHAHEGQRVNCAAVGPDRMLYTGGDDKVSPCGRTCCHCSLGGDQVHEEALQIAVHWQA